jgi:tetratricopeptide (TPR) repeat protein
MRAIAGTHRPEAVDAIFQMAFEYEGVFRDECGRQIRSMEAYAVPSLIRLMHEKGPAKRRRYASYQLDRMDRARPTKAIQAAPDDHLRAILIHAYGEAYAGDAVEAILDQVDAPSHRVRREARWAWLRYVSGKEPPPAPRRKRKLPGGKEEVEEKPDYLTYREIATLALQRRLSQLGRPWTPSATAKELTDELFAYYDQAHAEEWDAEFAAAHEKETRGDLQGAVDGYGWILAHDPSYARRGEMAWAFARYGDLLRERGDLARAVGLYREALDLDPHGAEAEYAEARVALLDGMRSLELDQPDPALFRRAIALDGSLDKAREGLRRAKRLRVYLVFRRVAAGIGLVGLMGLLLFVLWRRITPPPAAG